MGFVEAAVKVPTLTVPVLPTAGNTWIPSVQDKKFVTSPASAFVVLKLKTPPVPAVTTDVFPVSRTSEAALVRVPRLHARHVPNNTNVHTMRRVINML
jgi:hypothetical protein